MAITSTTIIVMDCTTTTLLIILDSMWELMAPMFGLTQASVPMVATALLPLRLTSSKPPLASTTMCVNEWNTAFSTTATLDFTSTIGKLTRVTPPSIFRKSSSQSAMVILYIKEDAVRELLPTCI